MSLFSRFAKLAISKQDIAEIADAVLERLWEVKDDANMKAAAGTTLQFVFEELHKKEVLSKELADEGVQRVKIWMSRA
jgi:hypothetical protein